MTPDLIALVLSQSLPVRLALLDAEPNGTGWMVPIGCTSPGSCYVAMSVTPYERRRVHDGAAWLPANPLAVVEHAARMRLGTIPPRFALSVEDGTAMASLVSVHGGRASYATSALSRDGAGFVFVAAIALLREVVG